MMKKLIPAVLIGASFLGGYYVGRLPGSPDLHKPILGIWRWADRKISRLLGSKSSPQPADTRRADSAGP